MKENEDSSNSPKSLKGITLGQLSKGVNKEGEPLTKQQIADLKVSLLNISKPFIDQLKPHYPDIKKFVNYYNECKARADEIFDLFNSDLDILEFDEKFKECQNNSPMDAYTLISLANLIEEKGISEFAAKRTKSLSIDIANARAKTLIGIAKNEIAKIYEERKSQFRRYGYTTEFNSEMHGRFPDIKSIKTIERHVAKLNKKNELIPR